MSYGVLIGRFQPLHLGHIEVIKQALETFETVIVLIGSTNVPRTSHDPWTYEERKHMLEVVFPSKEKRVIIKPLPNNPDDALWAKQIPGLIPSEEVVTLIAPYKDKSTRRYLDLVAPYIPNVWSPSNTKFQLHSTDLRKIVLNAFYSDPIVKESLKPFVHEEVISTILQWKYDHKDEHARLCREHAYVAHYSTEVKNYPRNELTADLCVVNKAGDKVLMIRRARPPGELLWAVPGGFVDQDETTLTAAFREFQEETNCALDSSDYITLGRIIFDEPTRSARARIASMVTFIQLTREIETFPTLGETLAVEWKVPDPAECFEDHALIAKHGLDLAKEKLSV